MKKKKKSKKKKWQTYLYIGLVARLESSLPEKRPLIRKEFDMQN